MTRRPDHPWLLATDVDRTLLTDDYRLPPQVGQAVRHARTRGIIVALATARGPVALEVVLRGLGEIDAAICFGGALTLMRDGDTWSESQGSAGATLDRDACRDIIEVCAGLGLSLAMYGRETVFVGRLDERLAHEFSHTGDRP